MGAKRILTAFFLCIAFLLGSIPAEAMDNPWEIMINIPECRLYLYYNGWLFKTFKVAVGKVDSPSPTGDFRIINKVRNPTWYPEGRPPVPPGPDNPLGKHWMGLNNKGYGIHGNSAAWSIGSPASKGCFRMDNHEIEELFTLVPVGTPVKVVYLTVKGKVDHDDQAWLEIYPDIYRRVNLELKVRQVLSALNWEYQPHLLALTSLITGKRPLTIMVPRKIKIEGDWANSGLDGFYWQDYVYLRRDFFKKNGWAIPGLPSDDLFKDYLAWDPLVVLEGEQKLEWDKALNTLRVNSLKLKINGEKIDQAVRFGNEGQIMVNYSKISNWFKEKQLHEVVLVIDTTARGQFHPEFSGGELWVALDTIAIQGKTYSYRWEEATWTLSLNYVMD